MTSPRPSWHRSISISGYSLRSGSVNRSKSNPYRTGHALLSPSTYPTIVPTPDPRARAGTPCSRPQFTKSHTIKKYAAMFLSHKIFSSRSSRSSSLPLPPPPSQNPPQKKKRPGFFLPAQALRPPPRPFSPPPGGGGGGGGLGRT